MDITTRQRRGVYFSDEYRCTAILAGFGVRTVAVAHRPQVHPVPRLGFSWARRSQRSAVRAATVCSTTGRFQPYSQTLVLTDPVKASHHLLGSTLLRQRAQSSSAKGGVTTARRPNQAARSGHAARAPGLDSYTGGHALVDPALPIKLRGGTRCARSHNAPVTAQPNSHFGDTSSSVKRQDPERSADDTNKFRLALAGSNRSPVRYRSARRRLCRGARRCRRTSNHRCRWGLPTGHPSSLPGTGSALGMASESPDFTSVGRRTTRRRAST